MDIECTDRRIGDMETLSHEVGVTKKNADEKMSKYYVK